MNEPVWLDRLVIDAIHLDQLREHGGGAGVRDDNALESAIARPVNKWSFKPDTDLGALAAAYGFRLANNHGYVDGNKRVTFMAMYTFLGLDGQELEAPEVEVVHVMLDVASGRMSEAALAVWVRGHLVRRRKR